VSDGEASAVEPEEHNFSDVLRQNISDDAGLTHPS